MKKVDAERQQAEAKNKEDMEYTVSTNAKATPDQVGNIGLMEKNLEAMNILGVFEASNG